jgi:hypothetical protein
MLKRIAILSALVLLASSASAQEWRKQSSTSNPVLFYMVSSTDHLTPLTGATVTVTCSKNGGAFGACSGAVSEVGNGWYALAGNATDRNTFGTLALRATATGADEAARRVEITALDPFDASFGLDLTAETVGTVTTLTNTANANVVQISGDSTAADNAEAAFDGGAFNVGGGSIVAASVTSFGTLTTDTATAVWASGTRSLTDKAGFALSSAALDAIWDEPTPHNTSSTMGALLTSAAAAGDPLSSAVPGAYSAGTAGYNLGLLDDIEADTSSLGGTAVTVTSPVISLSELELYAGDAYDADHARALDDFELTGAPSLTGATVKLVINGVLEVTATSVTGAGGATQTPIFELTAAQTALLTRAGAKAYGFQIQAAWAADSPSQPVVLAAGDVHVKRRFAP